MNCPLINPITQLSKINWTPVKQESGIGVTYGNGKYVSVGNGSISVSADGEYWKRATIQNGSSYN